MKLYFDKISIFHEGYCSGAECEYETEDDSKVVITEIPFEWLEWLEYEKGDEIPVTDDLRMKYLYSEERKRFCNVGLSGYCEKPTTDDPRINFIINHWVCNENAYVLTRIEVL